MSFSSLFRDIKEYRTKLADDSAAYKRVVLSEKRGLRSILSVFRCRFFTTAISDQYLIWRYLKSLRKLEMCYNSKSISLKFLLPFCVRKNLRLSRITGFQIPINTVGRGLTIYHYGSIIINPESCIGDHCIMRPDIVIGHKCNGEPSPRIGNHVTINSGARIIGDIIIGDDVIIAPNAVVTKDIPSHSIVAGVPARIIKKRESYLDSWASVGLL